jgi:outer membrane protein OmpA-like peptidoglycan-associated protein
MQSQLKKKDRNEFYLIHRGILTSLLLCIFFLSACSDDETQPAEKADVSQLAIDKPDIETKSKRTSPSQPPAKEVQMEPKISNEDLIAAYVSAHLSGDTKKFVEVAMQMSPELQIQAKTIVVEKMFNGRSLPKPEPKALNVVSGTVIRQSSFLMIENALVSLNSTDDLDIADGSPKNLVEPIRTGVNGGFEFKGIAPGHYELKITKEQYLPKTHQIDLTKKNSAARNMILELISDQQQQALAFGSLNGIVVDSATNLPVAQVEVVLIPSAEDVAAFLLGGNIGGLEENQFKPRVSDEDGNFNFASLPVGSYRVMAVKSTPADPPHYFSIESVVEIREGAENTTNVEVVKIPGSEVQRLTFSGYVYDQLNSEPISGALVFDSNSTFSTYTDDLGHFSVEAAAGELKLKVSHSHYQAYEIDFTLPTPDNNGLRVDLLPKTTGDIYVTVQDSVTGRPITDVQVTMAGQGLVTDQEGHFKLLNTESGAIATNFDHPAYYSETNVLNVIAVAEEHVTIQLQPITVGKISGVVTDAVNRSPLAGVLVNVLTESVHTDAEGRFTFEDIEAGLVSVNARKDVYLPTDQDVVVSVLETTDIQLSLTPITWGSLSGLVLESGTNLPVANAAVDLATLSTTSDDQGVFSLDKVPAGEITYTVNIPFYQPASGTESLAAGESIAVNIMLDLITWGTVGGKVIDAVTNQPIPDAEVSFSGFRLVTDQMGRFIQDEVTAGDLSVSASRAVYLPGFKTITLAPTESLDITIKLEPITWGSLSGRVLESGTNLPVANAAIDLATLSTTSDEQGVFSLDKVPAGEITYAVNNPYYQPASGTESLAAGESIAVTIMLDLITWGTVGGKVIDAITGGPIPDAEVKFSGFTLVTDQMGRFIQDEVTAGELSVSASKEIYLPGSKTVTLTPTDSLDITIELEPISTGTISGVVNDGASGKPVKGVRILIGDQAIETDQNGRFEIAAVDAGKLQISSRHPDYKDATTQFELSPAGTLKINLPLELRREDVAELETRLSEDGTIDLYGIHFDSAKDQFKASSLPTLEALLEVIRREPDSKFQIAGHTDSEGEEEYNQMLSERRAASVIHWLINNGISVDQLMSKGYGEGQPSAPNDTEAGKALNRRVQLSLIP